MEINPELIAAIRELRALGAVAVEVSGKGLYVSFLPEAPDSRERNVVVTDEERYIDAALRPG